MTDRNYADNLALLENAPIQAKFVLYRKQLEALAFT